jgi:hypothetical protein
MSEDRTDQQRDKGLANSSLSSSDGADSAEAAQHQESKSEIGDRIGADNESERGLVRAHRRAKPDVR